MSDQTHPSEDPKRSDLPYKTELWSTTSRYPLDQWQRDWAGRVRDMTNQQSASFSPDMLTAARRAAQRKAGHVHGEAFCHMTYRCGLGHTIQIFNSRDGVTPFGITCPKCGNQKMYHVGPPYAYDIYDPTYIVLVGDWFFRDGTAADAALIIGERINRIGMDGIREMGFTDRQEFIRALGQSEEFRQGWPMLCLRNMAGDTRASEIYRMNAPGWIEVT